MPLSHIPTGFHTVTPYLIVNGASRLLEFLTTVFGAQVEIRFDGPDGTIGHAALRIGDSMLEAADATPEWKAMPGSIHIYVTDVDAVYKKALAAGATSLREPADMFYGERGASVVDPFGNMWHIATQKEELSLEEITRRAAELHKA